MNQLCFQQKKLITFLNNVYRNGGEKKKLNNWQSAEREKHVIRRMKCANETSLISDGKKKKKEYMCEGYGEGEKHILLIKAFQGK